MILKNVSVKLFKSLLQIKKNIHLTPANFLFNNYIKLSESSIQTPEITKNLNSRHMLEKWLEMCRFQGEYMPQVITEKHIQHLQKLSTTSQKKKYLYQLCKKEVSSKKFKEIQAYHKQQIRLQCEERMQFNSLRHIRYGLWNNSMFAKIDEQAIANCQHNKLASAMIHNQSIVLDLDLCFENYMTSKEKRVIINDISSTLTANRNSNDPFNIVICNANPDSEIFLNVKNGLAKSFPIQIFDSSYLDIYPKGKLIYLSPDAQSIMNHLDPNATYIIGGITESGRSRPMTLAKAKKEKIKIQKLPLDRYLFFKRQKSLDVLLVMKILLRLQETGDWMEAFKEIPQHYLVKKD